MGLIQKTCTQLKLAVIWMYKDSSPFKNILIKIYLYNYHLPFHHYNQPLIIFLWPPRPALQPASKPMSVVVWIKVTTTLFAEGTWKILGRWNGKVVRCLQKGIVSHFSSMCEITLREVELWVPAQGVSNVKNMVKWVKDPSCDSLVKDMIDFCSFPKNLVWS